MEEHTHNHSQHDEPAKKTAEEPTKAPALFNDKQSAQHHGEESRRAAAPTTPQPGGGRPSSAHNTTLDHKSHYLRLLLMAVLSFASMYALMYAMVDIFGNVLTNLNQVYMAGLMTAPMVVIELLLMGNMYPNKRRNAVIITSSLVIGVLLFIFIRQQAGITDRQFLRSMIPHHAGAILMCEQAPITNPEIQQLCGSILTSQQQEIDQMREILDGLRQ